MPFNRDMHHRRSIRLRDYDYTRAGAYFVTLCTFERECLFGEIVDGEIRLNAAGLAVDACWQLIPKHFPRIELDDYVIMPNHIHGIMVLNEDIPPVGARHASPAFEASPLPVAGTKPQSLAAIVGSFKSAVSRAINLRREHPGGAVWQRNYFERVIRNEEELNGIRQYISNNPLQWMLDENHQEQNLGEACLARR